MRGETEFEMFAVGQRDLMIATSFNGGDPKVAVTWAGRRGKRETWTTNL